MRKTLLNICIILVLLSSIFVSCDNQTPPVPEEIIVNQTGKVVIGIAEESKKSISGEMPDPKSTIKSNHDNFYQRFLLTTEYLTPIQEGQRVNGIMKDFAIKRTVAGSVTNIDVGYFTQGKWRFIVKAVNEAGDVLYKGATTADIKAANAVNSISVTVTENNTETGTVKFDLASLDLADPHLVIEFEKNGSGEGLKTFIDTTGDTKGLVTEAVGNGYRRYFVEGVSVPKTGSYRVKIQLLNGSDNFGGALLDTWIFPGKQTVISGGFDISGSASFVRLEPKESIQFTEATSLIEIAPDKIVTGFTVLGSAGAIDFPYINNSIDSAYIIPIFEPFSTYFSLENGNVLNAVNSAKVKELKYLGLSHDYAESPKGISDFLFRGLPDTTGGKTGKLRAFYGKDIITIGTSAFAYNPLNDIMLGSVYTINERAFCATDINTFLYFGETVKIGTSAFALSKITEVIIPPNATVQEGAFKSCNKLATVQYGPTIIENSAFASCIALNTFTFPNGVTAIGDSAFDMDSALSEIKIEGIKTIGKNAFRKVGFVNLNIGSTIESIGSGAFQSVDSCKEIFIDKICGEVAGDPWGALANQITYRAYKISFNDNIIPDTSIPGKDVAVYPYITDKKGIPLPTPIVDPKYRLVAYNKEVGDTLDGYPLPIPERDGYGFSGWYSTPAPTKTSRVDQFTINKKKTNYEVYASWVKGLVTLVFNSWHNSEGEPGTIIGDNPYRLIRYNENYGRVAEIPDMPEEDYQKPLPTAKIIGRDFIGWFLTEEPELDNGHANEEGQVALASDLITNERIVKNKRGHIAFAHYKDHRYPLVFVPNFPADNINLKQNGVKVTSYPSISEYNVVFNYPISTAFTDKLTSPSYKGTVTPFKNLNSAPYNLDHYYFTDWTYDAKGTLVAKASDLVKERSVNGDLMKLFARWTGKEVNVSYLSNEISPLDPEKTLSSGTYLQRYKGLYSNIIGSVDNKMNDRLDIPKEFPYTTRTGYTFMGWYLTKEGAGNLDANSKLVKNSTIINEVKDHNVYAGWKPNQYTITYDTQGGTLPSGASPTKTVTFHKQYGTLPVPTREHYKFAGWYSTSSRLEGYGYQMKSTVAATNNKNYIREVDYVGIAKNHTLYAAWISVELVSDSSSVYSNKKNLDDTFTINPNIAGYYNDNINSIIDTNIAHAPNVKYKAVAIPTRKGTFNGATWSDVDSYDIVPFNEFITSVKSQSGNTNGVVTTISNGTFTATTTKDTIPSTQTFLVKTNYDGAATSGKITLNCTGALQGVEYIGNNDVNAREQITYTIKLKAKDAKHVFFKHRKLEVRIGLTNNFDTNIGNNIVPYEIIESLPNSQTYESELQRCKVKWGYDIREGIRYITPKASYEVINSDGTSSIKIHNVDAYGINIKEPANVYRLEAKSKASFITAADKVYLDGTSEVKQTWVIKGFKIYEGSYDESESKDVVDFVNKNSEGYYADMQDKWYTGLISTQDFEALSFDHIAYFIPIYDVYDQSTGYVAKNNFIYYAFPNPANGNVVINNGNGNSVRKLYFTSPSVTVGANTYKNCSLLSVIEFKNNDGHFESVGDSGFYGCKSLNKLYNKNGEHLLKKTTSIGKYAFMLATNLTDTIDLVECKTLGRMAFAHTGIQGVSFFGNATCDIPQWLVVGNTCSEGLTININTNRITPCAFSNFGYPAEQLGDSKLNIKTLNLGACPFIDKGAFRSVPFKADTKLTLPSTLTWGDYVGNLPNNDESDTFPLGSQGAFEACSGIVEVIPQCSEIGRAAFAYCPNLKILRQSASLKNIKTQAFFDSSLWEDDDTNNGSFSTGSIETIDISAFYGCKFTYVYTNASTIAFDAFRDCNALTSVKFGSSCHTIGTEAFASNEALTTVDFLEKGGSFNNMNFSSGNNVWKGDNIKYVKIAQSNFPTGNGEWYYSGVMWGTASTANPEYVKTACFYDVENSTWGTCWFGCCDNRGSNSQTGALKLGMREGAIPHGYLEGKIYARLYTNGSCEDGYSKIRWRDVGSMCSTCWNAIISNNYRFSGAGKKVNERSASPFNRSANCNDYVYPNCLWGLFPIHNE